MALYARLPFPVVARRQKRSRVSFDQLKGASPSRKLDWRERSVDHLSKGGLMFTDDLVLGRGKG